MFIIDEYYLKCCTNCSCYFALRKRIWWHDDYARWTGKDLV